MIKMAKKVEFLNSIKEMNIDALKARIVEDEMRLKKLQFAHAVTPLENPMNIRALRRDVSRLKTELRKKQLSA
jgi:large subunit ribosomal protein L29